MTDTTRTRNTSQDGPLFRSRDERIIAGVAGGLSEHMGINAWWFRWAFIILSFFGGLGVLLYGVAWLVIPDAGEESPIVGTWVRNLDTSDGGTIFGMVLVGAAVILVLTSITHFSGILIVSAVLFIVGLMLYRGDIRFPKNPNSGSGSPTSGTVVVEETVTTVEDGVPIKETTSAIIVGTPVQTSPASTAAVDANVPPVSTPPKATRPPKPPKPPRERSTLGRLTIAVGLIAMSAMALFDVLATNYEIRFVYYVAVAVGTIGLGLLIGAWVGRAQWLILIGFLMLPALFVTSLWPSSFEVSAGDRVYRPISVAEVDSPYGLGAGELELDLTMLSKADLAEIGSIEVSQGVGEMTVFVSDDVGIDLVADVAFGSISGSFRSVEGVGVDVRVIVGPSPPIVMLDLELGAGEIRLVQIETSELGAIE